MPSATPHHDTPLLDNIRKTYATTLQVLEHLEQSLIQAGFAESGDAYRRMADTVVGQSIWLSAQGQEIPETCIRLQERARNIHALLQPFSEAMLRITALPELENRQNSCPQEPAEITDDIIAALSSGAKSMSITALRSAVGLSKKELTSRLNRLEDSGRITRTVSGGRELIALTR